MRLIDADALEYMDFETCDTDDWYPIKERVAGRNHIRKIVKSAPAVDAVEVSGETKQAVELILGERRRQVEQWGDQDSNLPFEWMSILGEEYGELCRAVNETCFQNPKNPELGGNDNIISEAVQVATVAIAIIEASLGQRREDGDA